MTFSNSIYLISTILNIVNYVLKNTTKYKIHCFQNLNESTIILNSRISPIDFKGQNGTLFLERRKYSTQEEKEIRMSCKRNHRKYQTINFETKGLETNHFHAKNILLKSLRSYIFRYRHVMLGWPHVLPK